MAMSKSRIDLLTVPILKYYHAANLKYGRGGPDFVSWIKSVDDDWPKFRELFAGQIEILQEPGNKERWPESRWRSLMEKLASLTKGNWPDRRGLQKFLDAPVKEVSSVSYKVGTIATGVQEGVADIGKFALFGGKLYLIGAFALGGFILYKWAMKLAPKESHERKAVGQAS